MNKEKKIEALRVMIHKITSKQNTFICCAFEAHISPDKTLKASTFKRIFPELYNGIMEVGIQNHGADYEIGQPFIAGIWSQREEYRMFRIKFLKELLKKLLN